MDTNNNYLKNKEPILIDITSTLLCTERTLNHYRLEGKPQFLTLSLSVVLLQNFDFSFTNEVWPRKQDNLQAHKKNLVLKGNIDGEEKSTYK